MGCGEILIRGHEKKIDGGVWKKRLGISIKTPRRFASNT